VARIWPSFTLSPTFTLIDLTTPLVLNDKFKSVLETTCPVAKTVCFKSINLAISVTVFFELLLGLNTKKSPTPMIIISGIKIRFFLRILFINTSFIFFIMIYSIPTNSTSNMRVELAGILLTALDP